MRTRAATAVGIWLVAGLVPALALAHPVEEEPAGSPYDGTLTLYLNRCETGLSVQPGEISDSTQDVSSLLARPVEFFPYPHGDASWDEVLAHTRLALAPFQIIVTDADPSPEPHDEVVVCGNALEAGYAGLPGAAPLRCEPSQNPMSFVFAEDAPSEGRERTLAELVVQEAAHAWSLDHVMGCADMMGFDDGCGPKALLDEELDCGTDVLKNCTCGGKEQNSYHVIAGLFGLRSPDEAAPEAVITEPEDGAIFDLDEGFDVAGEATDDFWVAEVALVLDGERIATERGTTAAMWPVQGLAAGEHTLELSATDQDGNESTSPPVVITVADAPIPADSGGSSDGPAGDTGEAGSSGGEASGESGDDALADSPGSPDTCACRQRPSAPAGFWLLALCGLLRRRN